MWSFKLKCEYVTNPQETQKETKYWCKMDTTEHNDAFWRRRKFVTIMKMTHEPVTKRKNSEC